MQEGRNIGIEEEYVEDHDEKPYKFLTKVKGGDGDGEGGPPGEDEPAADSVPPPVESPAEEKEEEVVAKKDEDEPASDKPPTEAPKEDSDKPPTEAPKEDSDKPPTEAPKEDSDKPPTEAPKEEETTTTTTSTTTAETTTEAPKEGKTISWKGTAVNVNGIMTSSPTAKPTTKPPGWTSPPNPYIEKFNTTEWQTFHKTQWENRVANAVDINTKYGTYCANEPAQPMCPELEVDVAEDGKKKTPKLKDDWHYLEAGPTVICNDTGTQDLRCGVGSPWLNKTIWPLIRGPFCVTQDKERKDKYPLPTELEPYYKLGYNYDDTTQSKDGEPFDGGAASANDELPFDANTVKDHLLKFEAMLDHYYEGLSEQLLEKNIQPMPDSPLYGPMLKAYADQIARIILRVKNGGDKKMVIGVLGDSVTSGTDNCYFDAWPEVLRRQLSPIYASMGIDIEIRNAGKNGGWALAPQMLCAYDMLGVADRPEELGLDFLFQCNPFVTASAVDAEHLIRRALLGNSHTIVSMTSQGRGGVDTDAFLEKYASIGLTFGIIVHEAETEIGYPDKGFKFWFPGTDRSFWGMPGDGFCHLTTRAGSSAVVNRNWHWGPKLHEHYADAYALLLSRATALAIDELLAGNMPSDPPKPSDVGLVGITKDLLSNEKLGITPDGPPTWKHMLIDDMTSDEIINGGIGGVRCAIGSANQPDSILLQHWLRPAEGSPFETKMKERNGVSFVPLDAIAANFYQVTPIISPPNKAVEVGNWVSDPEGFGEEAPRTLEQCNHVDGSTLVNFGNKPDLSWVVWEVPAGSISMGRIMICHQRGRGTKPAEGMLDNGNVRFHIALPDGANGWKVVEDVQKIKPVIYVEQDCTPVVQLTDDADLKAAKEGGLWAAVEWKKEGVFDFDYLVAM